MRPVRSQPADLFRVGVAAVPVLARGARSRAAAMPRQARSSRAAHTSATIRCQVPLYIFFDNMPVLPYNV